MNRTLKKVLACVMTVIMLVSAAPLGVLAEIDLSAILPDLSVKSQAVNTTYNAVAAAEYAKRYAINYNKEWWFYSSGGDCANFVSQALFAGGMPMTSTWHCYDSNIHNCRMTAACDYTWIRAQQLCDYLISIGGQAITNPSASDFSIGDAVFYDWNGGRLDHSAVVTDIVNGQPKVSAHSTPESASRLNAHWTYNRSSKKIVLVKLYGKTCEENNSPSYDFYHMNQSTGVYTGPGYGYTQLGTITYYDMVRVTRTTSAGGRTWGYFNFRGNWGWVDLSKASYWGHFDRIQVNHIFGSWFTVKQATCIEDGLERHVCSRCGFTEDRILAKGGHVEKSPATCTTAAVCKACGITLTPALGHDFTQWVSVKEPTCVQKEVFERTCKRCNLVETKYGDLGNHNYIANVTTPGCTTAGTSTMKCSYCGDSYIEDIGDGWSSWTTEANSTLLQDSALYQKKTQYRYRDKEYTDSTNSSLSGWTKYDTTSAWSDYGAWSGWQDTPVSKSDSRQVETQVLTTYNYWHNSITRTNGSVTTVPVDVAEYNRIVDNMGYSYYGSSMTSHSISITYQLSPNGYTYYDTQGNQWTQYTGYRCCNTLSGEDLWFFSGTGSKTQYRYRDRHLIYTYYYYRWPSTWSAWQDKAVSATGDRQVEKRTVYRYKLAALNHNFGTPTVVAPKCLEKGYTEKTCSRCGFSYKYDYKNALGHNMGSWYTVVEATADTAGLQRRDCQRTGCGYYETRGHSLSKTVVDPTCTTEGYTLYKCTDDGCTVEYKADIIASLGHNLREKGEVIKAPTCEEKGLEKYTCTRCSYYEEKELSPIGHDYRKIDEKCVAPTCLEKGYDYYECANASEHNYTVDVDAIGHDFTEWKEEKPSTCGEEGYWYRDCQRDGCGVREEKDHYYLEHNYGEPVTTPPTCIDDGITTQTCSICGDVVIIDTEPALGHTFEGHPEAYVVTQEALCEEEGIKTAVCERCSIHDDIVTPPLGHDDIIEPIDSTCVSESGVKKTCQRCKRVEIIYDGEINPDAHLMGDWYVYREATCTVPGEMRKECQRDGCSYYESKYINASGHNMAVTQDTKADCITAGKHVEECQNDGCDYMIETVIPALGHACTITVVAPTCTEDGYDFYECQREGCDYTNKDNFVDKLGHDWGDWYEIQKATYDAPGKEQRDCKRGDASEERNTELIPKPKYTATFVVKAEDGTEQVIDTVTFEEGTKSITEPELPNAMQKDNYVFYWDWDGEVRDEDFTVYGKFEKIDSDNISEIEPEKTAEYKDGIATITLSAFAKTKIVEFASTKTTPVDVVMVLDQSGSMKETIGSTENGKNITRQEKLIECANNFVNMIYENAKKTGADHRVAMVGFAYSTVNNNGSAIKPTNTAVLTTTDDVSVRYDKATAQTYQNALMPISVNGELNSHIASVFSGKRIQAEGATAADLGLDMAKNIFANNPLDKTTGRKRIVIFLTDGIPTVWSDTSEAYIKEVAANAIKTANIIKSSDPESGIDYGAKIYSIGVNPACDVDADFLNVNKNGCVVDSKGKFLGFDFNRFLHYISSNYSNANAMIDDGTSKGGTADKDGGFYMAVNDTESFEKSFANIISSTVTHKITFSKATLVDTLSDKFVLTMQQEADMREKLKSELGLTDADITVTRNADGTTTLKFDNVPVRKVFDGSVQTGYKASLSFDVTAGEKAIDAGTYETNTEDSGVMIDDEYAAKFEVPEIVVPEDRNILVFNINGETFSIIDADMGDKIVAPVTDLAKWSIDEGAVVKDRVAVFEATTVTEEKFRTTWVVDGVATDKYFALGETIVPITVENKEDLDFDGWSPNVPHKMPNYPITFTAQFKPKHEHSYSVVCKGGDCKTGLVVTYSCSCGKTYDEPSEPQEHKYTAIINNSSSQSIEYFSCVNCGKASRNKLTFKCSTPVRRGHDRVTNKYLDLNLYDGDIKVQPGDSNDTDRIYISLPLSNDMRYYLNKGNTLNVYRVEDNGKETLVSSVIESDSFLVFEADHFSYYVICPVDPATGEPLDDPSYADAYCAFHGHSYEDAVTKPTFKEDGYTTHTCTVCGDTYVDTIVPANCDCICHRDNIFSRIVRWLYTLINKIFKTDIRCCDDMESYVGDIGDLT